MAFTFPEDSNFRIGAVRQAPGSNNFFIPSVIFGSDGITPLYTDTNPGYIQGIGSNTLLGEYSFTYASGAAANTVVNQTVPLPTNYQPDALYLATISNPSALGSALTVTFQNGISINGTLTQSTVTTLTIASGVTQSYLVQGIMLGDGAGQISISNAVATAAAGTAYVQVRMP